MARTGMVWGIDMGQCALKALRCRAGEADDKIVVEAFDFIEYPKILSQPDADPNELMGEAIKQFLSRNSVRGDKVAVSVSGQAGLARFIKLPPVEAKKIPDIVRYEARQQIPFDLNDVIWDYQRMGGGSEEEGFALETEIGLFAMKRDAVFRAIEPYDHAGIELDVVQLAPLALYNYVLFDLLGDMPAVDTYDPENPPESVVVVSLGTDSTDLVVTNGFRIWQRSIPLGGNHFTKALTKELKLTFAKAEHLKRNATSAQDPKAIFQAMRPVFNDLLTELQRSLGFFSNIDRHAKIGRIVGLGNAFKLPGLRRYLSQSLGYDIQRVDTFRGLEGPEVVNAPSFKENLLSFGVCYGLALQGLNKGGLKTNLLPKQIIRDRIIKEKKPWGVAAAALLLLACSLNFLSFANSRTTVDEEAWRAVESQADQVVGKANGFKKRAGDVTAEYNTYKEIGDHLVGNIEGRVLRLEVLEALNEALPVDGAETRFAEPDRDAKPDKMVAKLRDSISKQRKLHVTNLEWQQVDNLKVWYDNATKGPGAGGPAAPGGPPLPGAPPTPAAAPPAPGAPPGANAGPSGPGWVIQISGYHYHNLDPLPGQNDAGYVRNAFVEKLKAKKFQELGIGYPMLVNIQHNTDVEIDNPASIIANPGGGEGTGPRPRLRPPVGPGQEEEPEAKGRSMIPLVRFDFVVQFCWKPTLASQRNAEQKNPAPPGATNQPK